MDIWSKEEELRKKNEVVDNSVQKINKKREKNQSPIHQVNNKRQEGNDRKASPEKWSDKPPLSKVEKVQQMVEKYTKEQTKKLNQKNNKIQKAEEIEILSKQIETLKQERSRSIIKLQRSTETLTKRNNEINDLKLKLAETERELYNFRRDVEEKERDSKKLENTLKTINLKSDRQEEQISNLKTELNQCKKENMELKESSRLEREDFQKQLKASEKDMTRIVNAYSKQTELIEVLKQQKLHLEAAQVLKLTEDEFLQSLNWKFDTTKRSNEDNSASQD